MQKSGSGWADGTACNNHDQGPETEINRRGRATLPDMGMVAWNCRNMQDANVEFRQNSKYRDAGRIGCTIRLTGRQSLLAAACRGPGDWRCIF
jgi:hypothetical protein